MRLDLQTLRSLKPRLVIFEHTTIRNVFFISVIDEQGNELLFSDDEISLSQSDFEQIRKEFVVDDAIIQ